MELFVVIWTICALIVFIVKTVIGTKPSKRNRSSENSKVSVIPTEGPSTLQISTKDEDNDNLSSEPTFDETQDASFHDVSHKHGVELTELSLNENASTITYCDKDEKKRKQLIHSKAKVSSSKNSRSEGVPSDPFPDHEINKFLSAMDYPSLDKHMKEKGVLLGVIEYISNSYPKWAELNLNIAITGNSGAGKSSFINALRNLKPTDVCAAPVGVVETTTTVAKYTYSNNNKLTIWDLPGIGTQQFPREEYIDKMQISRFDVVIIISAGRFMENEIWLGNKVLALKKNVMFVRTKIDIDISNAKQDFREKIDDRECLDQIKNDMKNNLERGGISESVSGVFLISSRNRTSYDFSDLEEKLKEMLNIKGEAIKRLLKNHIEEKINTDKESTKKEFLTKKIGFLICGFLPVPFLETTYGNHAASEVRDECLRRFCLDKVSLTIISKELDIEQDELERKLKIYSTLIKNFSLYDMTEEQQWPSFLKRYAKYAFPFAGFLFSAYKSYSLSTALIEEITDVMADDAKYLMSCLLQHLFEKLGDELPL